MKRFLLILIMLSLTMLPGEAPEPNAVQDKRQAEGSGLVRVEAIDQHIVLDLRYASANNFTGKPVYPVNAALLQGDTALKLAAANAELMERGYRLKLWDAYRPYHLHQKLWEMAGDKRYFFADPKYGSVHNRGAAVDVTIVDARGREMEMPSDFDDFSGRGHRLASMSTAARANLDLLTEVMVRHGFQYIDFEWWHFEDISWWQYPILDLPLE
jgi:D-alanyl-D-alanine dipeptidase